MNINRHNYEEHFILYMDNEMGSEDRRQVEEFVEQNPDLKEELDLLMSSKFTPDNTVVFKGKDELMKEPGSSFITLSNYDEWLVMYMDQELTPAQQLEVERFISLHPGVQRELQLFQQTRLQPETIVFPDKESLYKRTEKVRVIAINWRRIAVAAVLLLIAGTTTVVLMNKKAAPEKDIAGNNEKKNSEATATNTIANNNPDKNSDKVQQTPVNSSAPEEAVIPVKKSGNGSLAKQDNNPSIDKNDKKQSVKTPGAEKNNESVLASNNNTPSNNLPQPLNNLNVTKKTSDNTEGSLATISNRANPMESSINKDINTSGTVTKGASAPSDFIRTAATITDKKDVADLDEPTSKKGKLRGFLRKVTRTFEKKTNINATDDDERLLVGGLAIKLK